MGMAGLGESLYLAVGECLNVNYLTKQDKANDSTLSCFLYYL